MTSYSSPIEILYTNSKKVSCDGGKTSGHPLIYLNIGNNEMVTCPYCSKSFALKKKASLPVFSDKKQARKK